MIRFFCGCLILVVSGLWQGGAWAASVVFLNPGSAQDPYWSSYSRFMQAAADRLGMNLHVHYTGRDTRTLLTLARKTLQGSDRPDYLVFSNELNVAPEVLRLSMGSGVRLMAVNNTFTADQLSILGDLRSRYPDFLGSVVANDEEGGYLVARHLIAAHAPVLPGQTIDMLAFSGTNSTPVSLQRERGLYRALAEFPQVRLRQIVLGGWRRDRAYEQAQMLLKRYPSVSLIWAASDQMAFGVMDAVREAGKQPGRDVLLGTINDSTAALQSQLEGQLSVVVGGHFTLGGWALVLLNNYDHADSKTRQPIGTWRVRAMQIRERRDAVQFMQANNRDDYDIDVRQFTDGRSPEGVPYPFVRVGDSN
ncbi:ABC transporter substrate-binding protein [Pseudomonas sp. LS-2]|jgi:ABC-type sugar transport system substrate-binding protein|uniref:ABC transporter substrate-binding protein n=1 Tax=Pseudomonas sp. LS-2 TaxID=2315859 RepID=UPI000E723DF8|nr:ABC transporter substrate-binding protein [Pseudomonas sp. LS-2]RJX79614.1 sugar ABC transporter substrate-binding protein [Pseudomonas sp. LS-2]